MKNTNNSKANKKKQKKKKEEEGEKMGKKNDDSNAHMEKKEKKEGKNDVIDKHNGERERCCKWLSNWVYLVMLQVLENSTASSCRWEK